MIRTIGLLLSLGLGALTASADAPRLTIGVVYVGSVNDYGYKTAGLEVFRRMLQGLTNDQIDYGMKHFLSKMDVDKITDGEHPEFGTVDKVGMFIRGALNKRLAENLKCTASMNERLMQHYHNYPADPEHFLDWQKILHETLNDAFVKLS